MLKSYLLYAKNYPRIFIKYYRQYRHIIIKLESNNTYILPYIFSRHQVKLTLLDFEGLSQSRLLQMWRIQLFIIIFVYVNIEQMSDMYLEHSNQLH